MLRMAPDGACATDMLMLVRWHGRKLAVPLAQLTAIDPDNSTERQSAAGIIGSRKAISSDSAPSTHVHRNLTFELVMTWLKVIYYERSVRGTHECAIVVFERAVRDDLSTPDRRSAGVLNQAMRSALHLAGSTNGEPKQEGNQRDRSHANEGEGDQCRFSHMAGLES